MCAPWLMQRLTRRTSSKLSVTSARSLRSISCAKSYGTNGNNAWPIQRTSSESRAVIQVSRIYTLPSSMSVSLNQTSAKILGTTLLSSMVAGPASRFHNQPSSTAQARALDHHNSVLILIAQCPTSQATVPRRHAHASSTVRWDSPLWHQQLSTRVIESSRDAVVNRVGR